MNFSHFFFCTFTFTDTGTTSQSEAVGRWSSEAFLEYIREQLENFTWRVSQRIMIQHENFQTITATASTPGTQVTAREINLHPIPKRNAIHLSKMCIN